MRRRRKTSLVRAGLALAALLAPGVARGGGMFAGDSGSQAQTRGGAFVARADDPTAILHNPAGLLKARRYEAYVGANVLAFEQSFQRAGTYPTQMGMEQPAYVGEAYPLVEDTQIQPVPFLAGTARFGQLAVGVGVFGPQGVPGRSFPGDPRGDWVTTAGGNQAPPPQRYDVVDQKALMVFPSVAVAYQVLPRLDVGARVSWGFGSVNATSWVWGILNEEEDPERDGVFTVDVSDPFIPAFGLGVLYRPTDAIEIGVSYNSGATLDAKGTGRAELGSELGLPGEMDYIEPVDDQFAACEPGGTVTALKACLTVKLPQFATAGGRYIFRDGAGRERGDVELDVRWENWSAASDIRVIVDGQSFLTKTYLREAVIRHGLEDVVSVRLGGHFRIPVGSNALIVRAGAAYDTAAAPTSWSRLDLDGAPRLLAAGGLAWEGASYRIDVGGGAIIEPDRHIDGPVPGDTTTVADRTQPDPVQPIEGPGNQKYHPINDGHLESGYLFGSFGVTLWF